MATKANMERAIREERWFWVVAVLVNCSLAYLLFVVMPAEGWQRGEGLFVSSFIGTGVMSGCVFRLTRAYKREITDLNSGDANDSSGDSPSAAGSVDDSADCQDAG